MKFVKLTSLAFTIIGFMFFFAPKAGAISDYDDYYKTTDKLVVDQRGDYPSCSSSPIDITNNWASTISTKSNYNDQSHADDYISQFSNALDHGAWTVGEDSSNPNGNKFVFVSFIVGHAKLLWDTNNHGVFFAPDHDVTFRATLFLLMRPDCSLQIWDANGWGSASNGTVSMPPGFLNFLTSSTDGNYLDLNYPDGYAGGSIVSSAGDDSKPVIRPEFSYSYADKDIKAKDHNQELPTFTPDDGYTTQGYSVEWSLFKCDHNGWDKSIKMCKGDSSLVDHQILLQNGEYKYDTGDYADYYLEAQYLVQECYRYPSYPSTPDYCFYVDLGTEIPDYSFTMTRVHLVVNGQTVTGDTTAMKCNEAGYCENPADSNWLLNLQQYMPKPVQTLYGVINSTVGLMTSLPSYADNCTPISLPWGRLGTSQLTCLKEEVYLPKFPALFAIYQLMLSALCGYWIGIDVFRKLKNQASGTDKVEVIDL